jgi:hypothetical protein
VTGTYNSFETYNTANVAYDALTFNATSTLTAQATREIPAVAVFTSTSTLTATAIQTVLPTVALTSTSTLSSAPIDDVQESATLTSTSVLNASAFQTVLIGTAGTYDDSQQYNPPVGYQGALFNASASLSVAPVQTAYTVSTFAASSRLTATATQIAFVTSVFRATSTLQVSASRERPAYAVLTSTSTLVVRVSKSLQVTFTSTSSLSALPLAFKYVPPFRGWGISIAEPVTTSYGQQTFPLWSSRNTYQQNV